VVFCLSLSNFCFARDTSAKRSTEVEEETLNGSFFGFGAASNGSGFCRTGGMRVLRRATISALNIHSGRLAVPVAAFDSAADPFFLTTGDESVGRGY